MVIIFLVGTFPFEYSNIIRLFEYEYDLSYSFSRIHSLWTDPNMNKGFFIRLFGIPHTANRGYKAD